MSQNSIEEAKELWATYWAAHESRQDVHDTVWSGEPEYDDMAYVSPDEYEMVWSSDDNCSNALEALEKFYMSNYGEDGLVALILYINARVVMDTIPKDYVDERQVELDKLTEGVRVTN
jgi:hypothetical protein